MRNWWAAKPWQVWPFSRTGWRYHAIYRAYREGARHPQTGWPLAGGEPRGRLASVWRTIAFPHVHGDEV